MRRIGAARSALVRAALVWAALAAAIGVPLAAAATSEQLAWRDPVYILAGFAGIIALALVFAQPLLVGGYLPGLAGARGRSTHRWIGGALAVAVLIHVAGLWFTSPPDMMDALMLQSPTAFSPFGVLAMWAIAAAALMAAFRRRLALRPRTWRLAHTLLAILVVAAGSVHALLIEGTMETVSKAVLCALTLGAAAKVIADRQPWRRRGTPRPGPPPPHTPP